MATQYTGWGCTHSTEIIAENNTSITIRVHCYWQNSGWRYNISNVYAYVYCGNQSATVLNNGAVNSSNIANTAALHIDYADFSFSKTHSSQSISCYAAIDSNSSYAGNYTRSSSASTVTVAARPTHTITYNANGGTGAPAAQTKWYSEPITLSTTKPTRTGHNFVRWNTNTANTGTGYNPGDTYNSNANLLLYAIWTPHTHTVSYNANGGTGAPAAQTKVYGTVLKLSSTIPTRTNYNFKGWSTSANGSVVYAAGGDYGSDVDVTLYAVWELAYQKPRITNFTANRCTSNGTISETGTYIKVSFNWATDKTVTGINVQYKLQTASSWGGGALTYSGTTSGTVTQAVGQGNISTESSYHVRVYVTDSGGTTYSSTLSIGTVKFPIDVKAGGKGVAIGKVAEYDEVFEVGLDSTQIRGSLTIGATHHSGNVPIAAAYDGISFDDVVGGGYLYKSGLHSVHISNVWYNLINVRHRNGYGDGANYGMQIRSPMTTVWPDLEIRQQHNGSWGGWFEIPIYTVLYDNTSGTTGTVTLSVEASNFAYLEIFFSHDPTTHGYSSTSVHSPNGKRVIIDQIEGQGPYMAFYVGHLAISGKNITWVRGNGMSIASSFTCAGFVQVNEMKVYKVVGYR